MQSRDWIGPMYIYYLTYHFLIMLVLQHAATFMFIKDFFFLNPSRKVNKSRWIPSCKTLVLKSHNVYNKTAPYKVAKSSFSSIIELKILLGGAHKKKTSFITLSPNIVVSHILQCDFLQITQ